MNHESVAQDALSGDPGYIDFQQIERWFDAPSTVEVNLHGPLLELVAGASSEEDPGLASLLQKIEAIQVRIFPLAEGRPDEVQRHLSGLRNRLQRRGWQTVVRVRENGEDVSVQLQTDGERIAGLMVMVVGSESNEGIFVNIVGNIRPEDLSRLGEQFDIIGEHVDTDSLQAIEEQ